MISSSIFERNKTMKKLFRILLPLLITAAILSAGALSTSAASEKISVCGVGTVYADADCAELAFSLEGKADGLSQATASLDKRAGALIKTAEKYGTVTTESFFSFTDCDGKTVAQRCYTVSVGDPSKLGELQDALIKGGASSVGSPIYMLKDKTASESAALTAAVNNAKAKAALLGASGEPSSLRELPSHFSACVPYCFPSGEGKICVEVKVILTYN